MKKQTAIKLPKDSAPASAEQMMHRTVVLILTINSTGNRRKLDLGAIDVKDNQEWLNLTKKLMDAEELKEITSLTGKTRAYIESLALPSLIKKGVYLLPVDLVEQADARMTNDAKLLKPLVEKMISRLPEYKKKAKQEQSRINVAGKIRDIWNEDQFPTADELRHAFRITWRYKYVDSAKNLETISKELYERERKRAEADWAETREVIRTVLRTQLSEMVNHLVDKLTPVNGLRKIFKASSIDNLNEFLSTFDARNITNDVQLKVLVDQAKNLIQGTDAETLRTNEEACDYARHGFETIKQLLDPMIVNRPKREIFIND